MISNISFNVFQTANANQKSRVQNKMTVADSKIKFGSMSPFVIERRLVELADNYKRGDIPTILRLRDKFIPDAVKKCLAKHEKPVIVGVAGESASGKSTFANKFLEQAGDFAANIGGDIKGCDNYYKDSSALIARYGSFENILKSGYSFDAPYSFDLNKLRQNLSEISKGHEVKCPSYDYKSQTSTPDALIIKPAKIVLLDCIFALNKKLRDVLDIGVYIDISPNVQEQRWFARTASRSTVGEAAKVQFADVKAKANIHVIPTKETADVVLSGETPPALMKQFSSDLLSVFKN